MDRRRLHIIIPTRCCRRVATRGSNPEPARVGNAARTVAQAGPGPMGSGLAPGNCGDPRKRAPLAASRSGGRAPRGDARHKMVTTLKPFPQPDETFRKQKDATRVRSPERSDASMTIVIGLLICC